MYHQLESSSDMRVDIPDLDISQTLQMDTSVSSTSTPAISVPNLDSHGSFQSHTGSTAAGDGQPQPTQHEPTGGSSQRDHGDSVAIKLAELQITQQFIDLLKSAALDKSGMQPEDIEDLRNPGKDYALVDPSPLLRSLRHFVNNSTASQQRYDSIRAIESRYRPDDPMLSFDQVKQRVRWLSGVVPMEHDMCVNSCMAFTGPRETLGTCARCGEARYCPGTNKPRKRFTTIPIGPVIQSLYSSHDVADRMHYLERKLADNVERARLNGGMLDIYDDTASGQALLDAWNKGDFKRGDIALQFSIDGPGAQLRPDRTSEGWFFTWVIHNLPPNMRYNMGFVVPGAIVPGPNKPWSIDSFMFPSLYHIASLQREGLSVYDAFLGNLVQSRPLVVFGTADGPGSAYMSGMVGHSARYGCQPSWEMPCRHRTGDSHYYSETSRPSDYDVKGHCHPDISEHRTDPARKYGANLGFLLASSTPAEFRTRRLAVGLSKQTIFSGLPCLPLSVPNMFMMDIMHLSVFKLPDLLIKLFTGKLDVYEPDHRADWEWAIFYRNPALWNAHGETVARAVPFIPLSLGRVPQARDHTKNINSGYNAWELQQYIYGLCPTLLRHLLPQKYWRNFCKLVAGTRILQRPRIPYEDLLVGHKLLVDFSREFEGLYHQRKESRIHFVRQSIHLLSHIAPETFRAGPLACYAQWTFETAIGDLGRETRQDGDMFASLTQRAALRAQINSLQARFPGIRLDMCAHNTSLPNGAHEFEGYLGYVFLPRYEECPSPLDGDEREALRIYWHTQNWPNTDAWPHAVCRWAKLQLPNGQKARSVWYEKNVPTKLRRSSCVEINYKSELRIADVLYYFYMRFGDSEYPLAMVKLFSGPDEAILSSSSDTVYLCNPVEGREGVVVVSIAAIHSVVAMVPDMQVDPSGRISLTGKFFLMRHPYIDVARFK